MSEKEQQQIRPNTDVKTIASTKKDTKGYTGWALGAGLVGLLLIAANSTDSEETPEPAHESNPNLYCYEKVVQDLDGYGLQVKDYQWINERQEGFIIQTNPGIWLPSKYLLLDKGDFDEIYRIVMPTEGRPGEKDTISLKNLVTFRVRVREHRIEVQFYRDDRWETAKDISPFGGWSVDRRIWNGYHNFIDYIYSQMGNAYNPNSRDTSLWKFLEFSFNPYSRSR